MPTSDLRALRLANQRLSGRPFDGPVEAVEGLLAVQAQDFTGAKWGVAQRCPPTTSAALDNLFAAGRILRTHVLRPTWHFVVPSDIRWLKQLTGPRVHRLNGRIYRSLELDRPMVLRAYGLIEDALRDGKQLTRAELGEALTAGGIEAQGLRLNYIMMSAELDALVCSGGLRAKQHTYALIEERAAPAPARDRDEALAELTRRYFQSHGPATAHDCAWWSGLTLSDVRAGLAMNRGALEETVIDGKAYWSGPALGPAVTDAPLVHLLPNYDEYFIAYSDRSALLDASLGEGPWIDHPALQAHIVALDGRIVGGWRRQEQRRQVTVRTHLLRPLDGDATAALAREAERLSDFLGLPVAVEHGP